MGEPPMSKPDPTRNERQRRWYYNHREQKNAETRRQCWEARLAGRCYVCYIEKPLEGLGICQTCREKRRKG